MKAKRSNIQVVQLIGSPRRPKEVARCGDPVNAVILIFNVLEMEQYRVELIELMLVKCGQNNERTQTRNMKKRA